MQQQIRSRASVEVAYIAALVSAASSVADNLALAAVRSHAVQHRRARDPRLPGGGGYAVSRSLRRRAGQSRTDRQPLADSQQFGAWSQYFNGVDVHVQRSRARRPLTSCRRDEHRADRRRQLRRARAPAGARPRRRRDERVRRRAERTPPVTPVSPYCHVASGMLTQLQGLLVLRDPEGRPAAVAQRSRASRARCSRRTTRRRTRPSRRRSAEISRATRRT